MSLRVVVPGEMITEETGTVATLIIRPDAEVVVEAAVAVTSELLNHFFVFRNSLYII